MNQSHIALREMMRTVPTLNLVVGELSGGAPALFAGTEPIMRCRNTVLGAAYAELIVAALQSLEALTSPDIDPSLAGESNEGNGAGDLDQVTHLIRSVLSLQPELAPKSDLYTKLVRAAVEPFLRSTSIAPMLPRHSSNSGTTQIPEFLTWLSQNRGETEPLSLVELTGLATSWMRMNVQ
ncbi:hypothetical protein [Pseudomonas fluorescens]|uniref:hypothetical protein n=1 Tax=Pseudomonas fluorescens TaxID=294 RepID=UPI00130E3F94|nr:hypothetical protein [Pseudomonas fluorescens]